MHEIVQIDVGKNLIKDQSEINLRNRQTWLNGTAFNYYVNRFHLDPEDAISFNNFRSFYDNFITRIGENTVELFIPIIFEKELSQVLNTQ